jgi:hypothetical protein
VKILAKIVSDIITIALNFWALYWAWGRWGMEVAVCLAFALVLTSIANVRLKQDRKI